MKHLRKLLPFLMIVSLILTLWTPTVSAAPPTEKATVQIHYFGRSALSKMSNGEALCYAYDRLVSGCESVSDFVDVSHRTYQIGQSEASLVYQAVACDHPEFFWLTSGMSIQTLGSTVTAFLPFVYDGIAQEKAALEARVAELTAGLEGKSDYDKSLILHDRLCDAVQYQSSAYDQTVIGSLVQGRSVCAGYARGYQLLLHTVGIDCFYVTGTSRGQGHAWNLVSLDGEWYYTDVTWDDQNDNGGYIFYAYLNLTYSRMEEDHTTTSEFLNALPRSTSTTANYHIKNGTAMASPNVDSIVAMYEAGVPVRMYATDDINTFISAIGDRVADAAEHLACPYSGYSYGTSRLGREIILRLSFNQPHNFGNGNTCHNCGYTRGGASEPDTTPGDANGDGKVNNRDLGILQQYLNEWDVTIDTKAADLNGDGKINNRDLGLLQQLLNQ